MKSTDERQDFKWKCVTSYYISSKTCNLIPEYIFFVPYTHTFSHVARSTESFCHGKSWFCVSVISLTLIFSSFHARVYLVLGICCCTFSVHLDYNLLDNWACIHILCKLKFDTPKYTHTYYITISRRRLCVQNDTLEYFAHRNTGTNDGVIHGTNGRAQERRLMFKCEKCLMCNCMGSWYSCFGLQRRSLGVFLYVHENEEATQ